MFLNKLRYFYRKLKGDILKNEYIYYPDDFLTNQKDVPNIFKTIYIKNTWGSKESVSGKGSEVEHTQTLIKSLNRLTKEFHVKSMLDAPCGDFNWMKNLDRTDLSYTGMDIVCDLINGLNSNFSKDSSISFIYGNIIEDDLPKVDMIFCRDCLVHFSFEDIQKALRNFKDSGSKYLITTTYPAREINRDIKTGGWRAINLQSAPFNLPKPKMIIHEKNLDDYGMYYDKSMGLWNLSDIENI